MAEQMENGHRAVQDAPHRRSLGRVLLDATAQGILSFALFLFGFLWWGVRWTFATIVFLAIMAGAGYYVFNRAVAGGEYTTVPSIVGRDITEAQRLLAEQGLEMGRQDEIVSDQVPRYHVIAQRPDPGQVVRAGRKVLPVVSVGAAYSRAPDLTRMSLVKARTEITNEHFKVGTHARVHHATPPDTVIAQYPAPNQEIVRGAEINLLVSNGPATSRRAFMPDIQGKPVEEVVRALASLGVVGIPLRVDTPGAPYDVVLSQTPEPGALVREGQQVEYEVRTSGSVSLPRAKRRVEVTYTVPMSWDRRGVQIVQIDSNGTRTTRYPQPRDYVGNQPPRLPGGTKLIVPVEFEDSVTIEVLLDGRKAVTYYYEGNAAPVITRHETTPPAAEPDITEPL